MERRFNFQYAMVHGTYWMYYGVLSSFSSVFLLARGFTNSQIGMIIALGNIIAVIVQPLLADFTDRMRRTAVFTVSAAMTLLLMGFTVPLIMLRGNRVLIACCYVGAFAVMMTLQPFCNALNRMLEETGATINFGLCRSLGSLFYAVLVYILGIMTVKRGESIIQPAGIVILAALFITFIVMRAGYSGATDRGGEPVKAAGRDAGGNIGLRQVASRHRMFIAVCAGTLGVYVANSIMNTYMAQITANAGGNSRDLGTVFSVLALLEIPTLIFFNKIHKRFPCGKLLKFSGAAFVVWIGICALARNIAAIIAAQFIQPFALALFLPSMIAFIDDSMDRSEAVKGHALFVTMVTAASIFASLVGGLILDRMGVKPLLTAGTVVAAAGAAIIALTIDKAAAESAGERKKGKQADGTV